MTGGGGVNMIYFYFTKNVDPKTWFSDETCEIT